MFSINTLRISIATIGLLSLFSLFIGTALALVLVGWIYALKVFVASALTFSFAILLDYMVKK